VVADHGRGRERPGAPLLKISVDSMGALFKYLLGAEQLAIVVKAVDADPETAALELVKQANLDFPVPLGNEVELGAEAHLLFQIGELQNVVITLKRVHVMREDQGEIFASGPAEPALRRCGGVGVNGPDVGVLAALLLGNHATQRDLRGARDQGFKCIECLVDDGIRQWQQCEPRKLISILLHEPLHQKRNRNDWSPTPSIPTCFNYFLNTLLPTMAKPIKPIPIKIIVTGS
jgi:hypothetical protein